MFSLSQGPCAFCFLNQLPPWPRYLSSAHFYSQQILEDCAIVLTCRESSWENKQTHSHVFNSVTEGGTVLWEYGRSWWWSVESQPKDSTNRGLRLNQIPKLFDGPYITAGWSAVQYLSAQHGDTTSPLRERYRGIEERQQAPSPVSHWLKVEPCFPNIS